MVMRKNTDTIPAKLTPREAVLNRNAAELLGRDTIKRLNDHGNMLSKRGVDLAALPSDPTPGPSTENMLGYQMGTSMVQGDDRADLLRDAENTFYGGGTAPVPTPTPTPPVRGYAYGTSSVDDPKKRNAASRYNRNWDVNPISDSQYIGRGGALLGRQYDPQTAAVNPLPSGAVGVQGFASTRNTAQQALSSFGRPKTPTEMAADIARRNLTATGSSLGTPQQPQSSPMYDDPNRPSNISSSSYNAYTGQPGSMADRPSNISTSSYQAYMDQTGTTTHFLPPGFTATTGSTGVPGSTDNDIHFLPPGFTSVQGQTNPVTKQLQQPDQGYGSAYGY